MFPATVRETLAENITRVLFERFEYRYPDYPPDVCLCHAAAYAAKAVGVMEATVDQGVEQVLAYWPEGLFLPDPCERKRYWEFILLVNEAAVHNCCRALKLDKAAIALVLTYYYGVLNEWIRRIGSSLAGNT